MIRIGSSCALSPSMALGKCVETRRFIGSNSGWEAVCKQAIRKKQYLILTLCTNRNDNSGHYPTDTEWIQFVSTSCTKLRSFGGRINNSRISLVNEPLKYMSKEGYRHIIDLAYPIVNQNGFLCGAGNEEFLTAQARGNMYEYILANTTFDILDVHLQGSCDTPSKTEYWCNTARSWTSRPIDCTEAFYADIATSKGWTLLKSQLSHAERIGSENFNMVFTNLDQSIFPFNTDNWKKLCFFVNGTLRSNYWTEWKILMDTKGPIPNIKPMEKDKEDMKLVNLKVGSVGNQVKWLQEILEVEYGYENDSYDGKFGAITDTQVRAYQTDKNLVVDGIVGRNTTFELIENAGEVFDSDYWWGKLEIWMAFE